MPSIRSSDTAEPQAPSSHDTPVVAAHRIATEPRRRRSRSGRWPFAWAALGLAAVVVAVWGRPVLGHFNSARLANPGDSVSFSYYLGWNVHALLGAHNLFFTPNMYAPHGLDLGNAISIPSVSLLLAPITLLAGTTAAYNAGFLIAIVLAACSTYLLAHELGARPVGAFIAALLMVLNPYFTGHSLSHFNLMWVFGMPLVAYLAACHLHQRLRGIWLVLGTALAVAFTFGASTELAVTETAFGALAWVVSMLFVTSAARRTMLYTTAWLVVGGVVGGLLSAPVILASLRAGVPSQPANPPALYSSDLLNVLLPTHMFTVGGSHAGSWSANWLGNDAENTAYLPIVLLVLGLVLLAVRRSRLQVALVVFAVISMIFSFGPSLVVDGTPHGRLPWSLTSGIPGLNHALPGRFSFFVFLALCLIIAVGWPRVRAGAVAGFVAVGVSTVLLLPDFGFAQIPTATTTGDFVTSGDYKRVIHEGQVVLVMPGGQQGPGLDWVVESNFYFRVPTGNGGGAVAPPSLSSPVGLALFQQDPSFDYRDQLKHWARRRDVAVVAVPVDNAFYSSVGREVFGKPFQTIDGVQLWRVTRRR